MSWSIPAVVGERRKRKSQREIDPDLNPGGHLQEVVGHGQDHEIEVEDLDLGTEDPDHETEDPNLEIEGPDLEIEDPDLEIEGLDPGTDGHDQEIEGGLSPERKDQKKGTLEDPEVEVEIETLAGGGTKTDQEPEAVRAAPEAEQ